MGLELIVDRTFNNQRIVLDNKRWQSCTFNNCIIVVSAGNADVVHCGFNNCRLALEGNAVNIVKIIEMFFPGRLPLIDGFLGS